MAAVVAGTSLNGTANTNTYTTGTFTPAVGDQLVVFAGVTGNTSTDWVVTDNHGGTYTKIVRRVKNSSADIMELWVRDALVSFVGTHTLTYSHAAGNASGGDITALRVSGMSRVGAAAIRQNNGQDNHAAGTPAPAFSSAVLTGNPTVGVIYNATNPATMTPPTGWTENSDLGHISPVTGLEGIRRDSGFTGTTVTWLSSSATAYCAIIAELDTSAAAVMGAGAVAGAGSASAVPLLDRHGAALVPGTGAVVSNGLRTSKGASAIAGVGAIVSTGVVIDLGATDIIGFGTITTLWTVHYGPSALAGSGVLTASGIVAPGVTGEALLSGAGTLGAGGTGVFNSSTGAGAIVGDAIIEATGAPEAPPIYGVVVIPGAGEISAIGAGVSLFGESAISGGAEDLPAGWGNLWGPMEWGGGIVSGIQASGIVYIAGVVPEVTADGAMAGSGRVRAAGSVAVVPRVYGEAAIGGGAGDGWSAAWGGEGWGGQPGISVNIGNEVRGEAHADGFGSIRVRAGGLSTKRTLMPSRLHGSNIRDGRLVRTAR